MKNKVNIAKLKKVILKNIENEESSSTQYLVSTFKLWTQFASTQHKKSNFNKLYKIHQDTLTLLIDEDLITNSSNKPLSDTGVKLSPKGRQYLNKPILEVKIKDLLQNPWIITIVGGVVVILVGAYMFGIGKPDNLHINDEKEVPVKTQNPNSVSIGINYLTLKETIGEPIFINKSGEFSEYIYM